MDAQSARIPVAVADAIQAPENRILLSVASIWEIQIKVSTGKLRLGGDLPTIVAEQRSAGLSILPVMPRHVFALDGLPDHRRDPFDRFLIAQAQCDGLTHITADPQIARYPVATLW